MDPETVLPGGRTGGSAQDGGAGRQSKGKEKELEGPMKAVADGGDSDDLSVNLERGLVLHGGRHDGHEDGEEEEFDFGEEEEDGAEDRWLAIARFYSGRAVKAKVMFSELSNAWGEVLS